MKILVLGSMKEPPSDKEFGNFQRACRDIGRALAVKGHTLILGSDDVKTADRYVMEGFASVSGSREVIIHYPEVLNPDGDPNENNVPFIHNDAPVYPNLKIRYCRDGGPWTVAHTAGIHAADVAILIGGRRRSDLVGHLAPALEKPILAVPLFGGAAQNTWSEFKTQYRSAGFTEEELANISVHWDSTSGATVANAIEKLFRKNPFKKESKAAVVAVCSLTLLALAGWVLVFGLAHRHAIGLYWSFFVLLALATLMGTGLRVSSALVKDPGYRIEATRAYAELTTGLILSFGFMLFYLVGALVFTGDLRQLNQIDDFTRTAISLSAIGLATALLLEQAGDTLSTRLQEAIFKTNG